MPEIAAYVLGEILCYALFFKTSRLLIPVITGNRVRIGDWEDDLINHNRQRFGKATHVNGQYTLDCGWGILFGLVFWALLLTGLGIIFL